MAREYELVLMLDPEAPDERREEIADGARKRIESDGELRHAGSWGTRKMAYEIRQRTEADYRIYRFASDGPLLTDLDHTLKITDGVLRFRIFKVDQDAPMVTPPPGTHAGRSERGERRGERRGRPDRDAPAAEEPAEAQSPEAAPAEEPQAEPAEEPQAEPAEEAQAEPAEEAQAEPAEEAQAEPAEEAAAEAPAEPAAPEGDEPAPPPASQ